MTKHAIEGYSESLDHELRTFGIRVVLVEPGVTRTSFEEDITKPDRLLPIYDSVRPRMEALTRKWVEAGDAPEVVADTVVKAATEAVPRRRYTAGKQAGQVRFLRRFLPESMVDKSLRKFNELPVCREERKGARTDFTVMREHSLEQAFCPIAHTEGSASSSSLRS